MKKCKEKNILCDYKELDNICSLESHCGKQIIVTQADKIRSMSDEELAELINDSNSVFNCEKCDRRPQYGSCDQSIYDCIPSIIKWLQREVEA